METGMCVNSRNRGGANVYREVIFRVKNVSKIAAAVLSAAVLFAVSAGTASAELPAPNFMPGFPLLAGPQVILMWTPVPGATKYFIYMNGEKLAESASFQYTMATPEKSGAHLVTVAGVDAGGKPGKQSSAGTIKIIVVQSPGGLASLTSQDTIGIRWDQAEGAVIYNVYKAESETGEKKLLVSTQEQIIRDKEVQKGKTYYYWATAKDSTGRESAFGKAIAAKLDVAVESAKVEKATLVSVRIEYEVIRPAEGLISPTDMVFSKGKIYLTDNSKRKVRILGPDGQVTASFGQEGYLDGQFMSPLGIAIHGGTIAVGDMMREVILLFNQETNEFVKEFAIPKKDKEKEKKTVPSFLSFTPKGTLVVIDEANYRIVEMDLNGNALGYFGVKNDKPVFVIGTFGSPAYVTVDANGRIYVGDSSYGKITVLDKDLKPLYAIGLDKGVGSFVGIGKPAFDVKNGVVYTSDPMLATLQAFGLEDGKYRFSLFDKDKSIMTEYVPKWDIGSPRVLLMDDSGQLWVIMALDRALAKITKFLDPLPKKASP